MARSDRRIFIMLAVDMPRHPKLAGLTKGQKWLIAEALMYCREFKTDGVIDLATWRRMDTKRNRDAVEESGMCITIPAESRQDLDSFASDFYTRTGKVLPTKCVFFPGYFDHQQSSIEIDALHESRSSAGRKGGQAKAENAASQPAEGVASATADGCQTGSKNVPYQYPYTDSNYYVVTGGGDGSSESGLVDGSAPAAPTPLKKTKRATRLPEGWMPRQSTIDWAKSEHPNVNLELAHEKFTNYWLAKSGKDATKVDWDRTWRNWIISDSERVGKQAPKASRAAAQGRNAENVDYIQQRLQQIDGGADGGQFAIGVA